MDGILNLFDSGNWDAVQVKLHTQMDSAPSNLLSQLIVANNVSVCKYMMVTEKADVVKVHSQDLKEVIQKCLSVPCREDILNVEVTALYNYMYLYYISEQGKDLKDLTVFNLCYRILSGVCNNISMHKDKIDFEDDVKHGCLTKIWECLHCLKLGIVRGSLSASVCHLICMKCVMEIISGNISETRDILSDLVSAIEQLNVEQSEVTSQPCLMIPYIVDQSNLPQSQQQVLLGVAKYLHGVCCCYQQNWEECTQAMESVSHPAVQIAAKCVSGFALYKNGKFLDSVCLLMEVLRSEVAITQRLKAKVYHMIGRCFYKLQKHWLSIQMYREALSADFSYLLPLYSTSLQYQMLANHNLELECLNLLVTALEKKEKCVVTQEGIELLHMVNFEDDDILFTQALYCFAKRSLELCRYDVAAEKFVLLLNHLKSWECSYKETESLPSLLQIHHEAIESLLKAGNHQECIELCDHVLACYSDSLNDVTCSQKSLEVLSFSQTHGKRKHNNSSQSEDDRMSTDVDVLALKYKAEGLMKLGNKQAALSCLQRAIDNVSAVRKLKLQACLLEAHEPIAKRARLSKQTSMLPLNKEQDGDEITSQEVDGSSSHISEGCAKTLKLECEMYTMMADILTALSKHDDALHFKKLVAQIKCVI